ncbi:coniferyl aldehyde dehydrogenase [Vibrio furnissii]|uniref:coniferyl aldehyde dehydrogenase n=1 Tax=Vibrio furnissii TaxID=29494 RepID=UPI0025723F26|nr:coniferyl aldehyde dehydrogenase [Vibrio furnissii]WJG23191.1 coniferyl aldehyde dehydrogenase [Vibrio furnissii]
MAQLADVTTEPVGDVALLDAQFGRLSIQFANDPYPSLEKRQQRLVALRQALLSEQNALAEALSQDFGFRSRFDSLLCDIVPAVSQLDYTLKSLKRWMKPQRRKAGLILSPSRVRVRYQPLGVVGIIVPWNFPVVLSLAPLVTAVAAGNQVMLKLSEHTPHTNQVLRRIVAALGDIALCVEGEAHVASAFSALPFQHLLFTGSTAVGRKVALAAAHHLTPVTLELGGKSPVIIAPDADLTRAVDQIMLGKATNSGQICVAPDYVMLPEAQLASFTECYLRRFAKRFVNKQGKLDCTHIINATQYQRLHMLLDDARQHGAEVSTFSHPVELAEGQMAPHVITQVTDAMRVMQEEIFGPILPLIGYRTIEEAIERVNAQPRPLALYVMSDDQDIIDYVLKRTHSGGVAINDTLLHVAADDAPFGGVGESGMGHYHGIEGFQTFSHAKTVLHSFSKLPRSRWLLNHRKLWLKLLSRFVLR